MQTYHKLFLSVLLTRLEMHNLHTDKYKTCVVRVK